MNTATTQRQEARDRVVLQHDIEQFLYHEAALLDDRRFEEWLDLLTDDIRYWMPMIRNVDHTEQRRAQTREGRDINWFDEGKDTLEKRVRQILTGEHWAEEPLSRTRHLVTNVRIVNSTDGEITVRCCFFYYRNRVETETDLYVGEREDVLRETPRGWRICRRKITLDQNVLLSKNLTIFF